MITSTQPSCSASKMFLKDMNTTEKIKTNTRNKSYNI